MKLEFLGSLCLVLNILLLPAEIYGQCPCTIGANSARLLGNGTQYKVVFDSSITNATFKSNVNYAVSSWRTEENWDSTLPKIDASYPSTRQIVLKFDNLTQTWINRGANSTYSSFAFKESDNLFTIVFFNEKNPLSLTADQVKHLASHELGHAHGLKDATGANCGQNDTVMKQFVTGTSVYDFAIGPRSATVMPPTVFTPPERVLPPVVPAVVPVTIPAL